MDAGIFMMKLMNLKKRYGWSLLVIAHTQKRSFTSPITQNDLAESKKLYNFFDSVFAIGKSYRDIADWLIRNLVTPPASDLKRHSQAFLLAARCISPEYQEEVEALIEDLGLELMGTEKMDE